MMPMPDNAKHRLLAVSASCALHMVMLAAIYCLTNSRPVEAPIATTTPVIEVMLISATEPAATNPLPPKPTQKSPPLQKIPKVEPASKAKRISKPQKQPAPVSSSNAESSPAAESGAAPSLADNADFDHASSSGKADYFGQLRVWLEKHKTYPRAARLSRIEGVVVVHFTVNRAGEISQLRITGSSGNSLLDEAALDAVKQAVPLPSIPDSIPANSLPVSVPFSFRLK